MENLYIAIDSNSKLGKEFIPQDPKEQSKNGMLLGNIIKKHSISRKCPSTMQGKNHQKEKNYQYNRRKHN